VSSFLVPTPGSIPVSVEGFDDVSDALASRRAGTVIAREVIEHPDVLGFQLNGDFSHTGNYRDNGQRTGAFALVDR
jgi:hypothetical protein